jgi:hypothetical protein
MYVWLAMPQAYRRTMRLEGYKARKIGEDSRKGQESSKEDLHRSTTGGFTDYMGIPTWKYLHVGGTVCAWSGGTVCAWKTMQLIENKQNVGGYRLCVENL